MKAKKAYIDIETAPNTSYVWGHYEQNVIAHKKPWYILSVAVKWDGEKNVKTYALPDYPLYKKDKENDYALCEKLWEILDSADIIVAHNGDGFDLPKIRSRLINHGFKPPRPSQTIDTLKIARQFAFNSNKLNDLSQEFHLGEKVPHTGFALWMGCMNPKYDAKSWALMRKYNAHDVVLLEKVEKVLLPWAKTKPNMNVHTLENGCPSCGSTKVQKRGFRYLKTTIAQAYQCTACGAWSQGQTKSIGITIK